jgi:hypothetical protein
MPGVHDPTRIGKECTNKHKATNRQLFLRSRQHHPSIPSAVRDIVPKDFAAGWAWLFAGKIPGMLQLHLQMHACGAPRTLE